MHTDRSYPRSRRNRLRPAAATLLALAATQLAFAQAAASTNAAASDEKAENVKPTTSSAPVNPADEVITMDAFRVQGGFHGSLAAAAESKQNHMAIVEVIASEDIGKLPDTSIADSLTRLTGLTTQRTNGRSQAISIRGLTGDFSTATLNGREQVSTGLNRAVEFDQYPAELLSGVMVYKTATPNLTGQGLAGTIDLQTVHPLSKPGRTVAASAFYDWTQLKQLTPGISKDGQHMTFSYVDQFDNNKLGVAIGVAYSSKPFEGQQFQAWGYPTDSAGNYALGGTKSYVRTSNLDRTGTMAVIEYKPTKWLHSTIDIYGSHFKEKQMLRGMEIPLAYWSSASVQSGYTVTNGLITQMTLKNIQPVLRNDAVQRTDDLIALGWNLQLGEKDGWLTTFDVGYSKVKRKDQNLESYSGLAFNQSATSPDTMTVTLTPGEMPQFTHSVNYANAANFYLTDPQGWGTGTLPTTGMQGYLKYFQAKDEMGQVKLSTQHDVKRWGLENFEVGTSFTKRFKRDGESPTGYIYNKSGKSTASIPSVVGTTDLSFLGLGNVFAYDSMAAWNNGAYGFLPNPNADVIANRWNVTEKITRGYFCFNIKDKVGKMPLTGNVGAQLIQADQESSGRSSTGSGGTLQTTKVSGGDKYYDFAPSLNLALEPADDFYVRFSVARQIARPRMYDMKAGRTFNYNSTYASSTSLTTSPWSGDGGNPKLRPWRADSLDLSLEKYFANNMGYVSLTGFYKKLRSYIYQQSVLADFTGYPITGSTTPVLYQGTITTPQNGEGGSLKGLEATVSLPSELISKEIKGFGVVAGYAYTKSDVQPWGPGNGTAPIAGLAKNVANVTVYYERHGFSARISQRYRSATREYITTFGPPNFKGDSVAGNGFSLSQPERVLDAQVSYTIKGSGNWYKDITIYLQGYNLANEPLITYNNGDPRQVTNYQKYGASYSFGVAYKF